MKITTRRMDFAGLKLPGGTRADSLRVGPLYRELEKLKVVGVTAYLGKFELLERYRLHVEAQQPETKPYDHAKEFLGAMAGRP